MPPICGTGIGTGIEMGWDGITITGPTSASPQWSRAWDCGAAESRGVSTHIPDSSGSLPLAGDLSGNLSETATAAVSGSPM